MEAPIGFEIDKNMTPKPKDIEKSDNSIEKCFICGITSGIILKNYFFSECNHRYCVYCLFRSIFRNNLKEIIEQNRVIIKCKCNHGKIILTLNEIDNLIKNKSKIDEEKCEKIANYCIKHRANCEYFCRDCDKYICIHCKNQQEQAKHKIVLVSIYNKMYKEFIRGIPLKFKYSEDFKLHLDKSVDKFSKELAKNINTIINDINKMIEDLNMIKNNYISKLKKIQENGLDSINLLKSFYFEYYHDLLNLEKDEDIFSLRYLAYIKHEIGNFEMNFDIGIFNKFNEIKERVQKMKSLDENPFYIKINYLDIPTNLREVTRTLGHDGPIICLSKIGDNQFISGSLDNSIKFWNLDEEELKPFKVIENFIGEDGLLLPLKDNKICISSFNEKCIKIYKKETSKTKAEISKEEKNNYQYILLAGLNERKSLNTSIPIPILKLDNNLLMPSAKDGVIILWKSKKSDEIEDYSLYETIEVCQDGVCSLCKIKDDIFASGDVNGQIKLWKNELCQEKDNKYKYNCYQTLNEKSGKNKNKINCLILLNDNNLCSGDDEGNLIVYKNIGNEKYEKLWLKKLEGEKISCLLQIKQGNLISGSYNQQNANQTFLKVWEINNGFEKKEDIDKHYKPIRSIIELEWGNIVSTGEDGTIIVWKSGVLID